MWSDTPGNSNMEELLAGGLRAVELVFDFVHTIYERAVSPEDNGQEDSDQET